VRHRRSTRRLSHIFDPANRLRLTSTVVTIIFFLLVIAVIGLTALFAFYSRDLPRPDRVRRTEGFSTVIYDRSGGALYDIYDKENRIPIELGDIPTCMRQATVAIEDKDFYKHQGYSQAGMVRAILNIIFLHNLQGGSTLTQQLVKNVLLTSERSFPRKIKEFILAVQIERKYSKDEILQMYLNEAPYGGTTAGVEKASQYYFDKHAKDLSLLECVILAGLPNSPSHYSPFNAEDPKAYVWRSEQVTRRMREDGYITSDQEKEIKDQLPTVAFTTRRTDIKAAHFVMYVRQQLIDRFGEQAVESGGLRVTTTLDGKLQEEAEKIVAEEIEKLKGLKVGNGAAVVTNPKTGEILAMVGSKDYFATQGGTFNIVTQATRQPGSSIKPITYATALKKGYTPATVLLDVETHFPGGANEKDYVPKNYDGKFHGPMQLRFALGNSINVVAVKLQALVGVKEMLKVANEMGLTTLAPTDEMANRLGLSVVLGGGDVRLIDMASSFGVFATGGTHFDPYAITKVTDSNGKVLWEQKPPKGKKVLPEEVAFLISNILQDNDARKEVFGEKSLLVVPGKTVSVKTGTTDDIRDNWTIGFTPSVVIGVWVGNNDNSPMNPRLVSGVTGAAPIWNRIMRGVLKDHSDEPFKVPANVVQMDIDAFAGGLPRGGMPTRKEYFIKGTEPTEESPVYKKLKISKSQNDKLANPVEVATGNYDEKEFFDFEEKDTVSSDGKNRWQEAIDAWAAGQSDNHYKIPKGTSTDNGSKVVVSVNKPNDKERIDSHDVQIEARATSVNTISRMELEVDGSARISVNDDRFSQTINLPDGNHRIKVKAFDDKGNSGDTEIRIGVNAPWDSGSAAPTNTPTPSPKP